MKKELTLRWTKTKPLTRQGRGKEEETASVASLFVLFKFKPLSKNGEYYSLHPTLIPMTGASKRFAMAKLIKKYELGIVF